MRHHSGGWMDIAEEDVLKWNDFVVIDKFAK
jgi:hypothetical protein